MRRSLLALAALALIVSGVPAHAASNYNIRDCGISSLSGSSQSLAVANPNRKYLGIFNTGANTVYVNAAGGTAASSGVASVALAPNWSLIFQPDNNGNLATNAITIIGTSTQPVACFEGK